MTLKVNEIKRFTQREQKSWCAALTGHPLFGCLEEGFHMHTGKAPDLIMCPHSHSFFFWRPYCVLICSFGFKSSCKLENNLFPHKIASDSVFFWKSIYLTQSWHDLRLTPWDETQTQDCPSDQEPETK